MHINYWQTFRKDGLGRAGLGLLALVVGLALPVRHLNLLILMPPKVKPLTLTLSF